jgi:hypothetical protein
MPDGYNSCKKCKRHITRYTIDRAFEHVNGNQGVKTYSIKFCWGCGYFSIYPNVRDEFTNEILRNRFMIIELIEEKLLKPVA